MCIDSRQIDVVQESVFQVPAILEDTEWLSKPVGSHLAWTRRKAPKYRRREHADTVRQGEGAFRRPRSNHPTLENRQLFRRLTLSHTLSYFKLVPLSCIRYTVGNTYRRSHVMSYDCSETGRKEGRKLRLERQLDFTALVLLVAVRRCDIIQSKEKILARPRKDNSLITNETFHFAK